jgi:uncharacterized protein YndB with AHSA1/START domain/DNA-binding transcriptional ArsR family regulator
MASRTDTVFKALSDPVRRRLLDRLHERNGQTLGELTTDLGMARQSATQHLAILEDAELLSVVWRGRQKLHYLNPVPLHQLQERWIDKFEQPRLRALSQIRRHAEENTMNDSSGTDQPQDIDDPGSGRPTFVYVSYIRATPERVWEALTSAELTAEYWGHSNVSDWQVGSRWEHRRTDGSGIADVFGTVVASVAPERLVVTFADAQNPEHTTQVTFEIEAYHDIVRLVVTHENLPDRSQYETAATGWAAVVSNLKSLLETGHALPQAPWEMPADIHTTSVARNRSDSVGTLS